MFQVNLKRRRHDFLISMKSRERRPTWKSSALLFARSALFPARAITIFGLACLCSSLTQFFARTNDSCKIKQQRGSSQLVNRTISLVWWRGEDMWSFPMMPSFDRRKVSLGWWCFWWNTTLMKCCQVQNVNNVSYMAVFKLGGGRPFYVRDLGFPNMGLN